MTITITESDIANGQSSACTLCPIALALERATGERWFVGTKGVTLLVHLGDPEGTWSLLPDAARAFVQAFDKGQSVEPFSFELDIPAAPAAA